MDSVRGAGSVEAEPALTEIRDHGRNRSRSAPLFARQMALGSGTNRQGGRLRRALRPPDKTAPEARRKPSWRLGLGGGFEGRPGYNGRASTWLPEGGAGGAIRVRSGFLSDKIRSAYTAREVGLHLIGQPSLALHTLQSIPFKPRLYAIASVGRVRRICARRTTGVDVFR
jgi:hypothetical protein